LALVRVFISVLESLGVKKGYVVQVTGQTKKGFLRKPFSVRTRNCLTDQAATGAEVLLRSICARGVSSNSYDQA
jgi:hypothetical protein